MLAQIRIRCTIAPVGGSPRMVRWRHSGPPMKFSKEVRYAMKTAQPIVALESTIISHGMPYPQNIECARQVEQVVRENGATPATIAILEDGVPHIGLEADELERFAKLKQVRKCSRRDLALSIGLKEPGATTVASTMILAKRANIPVFVTGGCGGVHRMAFDGASPTTDVSADLTELGRTDITVVCAGVKSILDIGRTLEYLETQGVTVLTLGQSRFPAFFTTDSGIDSPASVSTIEQAAAIIDANQLYNLESGMLLAVPNPNPMDAALHDQIITQALKSMEDLGISGKEVTPFLLDQVNKLSGGESLASNITLVKHNARVGAQLARALWKRPAYYKRNAPNISANIDSGFPDILVAGIASVDITGTAKDEFVSGTSNPGTVHENLGGVGRNIAEIITNMSVFRGGGGASLMTVLGSDMRGERLIQHCEAIGIDLDLAVRVDSTATYLSLADNKGNLIAAVADMEVSDDDLLPVGETDLRNYKMLVIEGNMTPNFIGKSCLNAHKLAVPVLFEPVSVAKSIRAVDSLTYITIVTPNELEVKAMASAIRGDKGTVESSSVLDDAICVAQRMRHPGQIKHVVVTLGSEGVLLVSVMDDGSVEHRKISGPDFPQERVVNCSGAGDTLAGALAWFLVQKDLHLDVEAMTYGIEHAMELACVTIQTERTVPSVALLHELLPKVV
uniref:Carbohydrate kinase PfkB domain-containing protein n=1 Tax=Mucochytrium quahogii TaxID=96639 RepID=A0A7S2SJC3_9STRA|mmetsp:Transcript_41063/g.66077  ORF Transcript_41063/g.66077 Transcript_41063/m.66077 type:complete len:679 (-) Transcript_41063:2095-4131(-)